jgi:hypothetical protein
VKRESKKSGRFLRVCCKLPVLSTLTEGAGVVSAFFVTFFVPVGASLGCVRA